MGRLIDTSILIESERGRLHLEKFTSKLSDEEFFLSVVTVSELLHGVHRANDASVRAKRGASVEGVLQQFSILDVDVNTARLHAQLWADLEAAGNVIGPHDLWLAATCIAHGLIMVTANVREFQRVPGLSVEVWSSDEG